MNTFKSILKQLTLYKWCNELSLIIKTMRTTDHDTVLYCLIFFLAHVNFKYVCGYFQDHNDTLSSTFNTWEYLQEYDRSLRSANKESMQRIKESRDSSFSLSISVDISLIEVQLNNNIVYSQSGGAVVRVSPYSPDSKDNLKWAHVMPDQGFRYPHSGLHLVVLHPHSGVVLHARRFLTHQPAEHENLAQALSNIQPGRIIILAGVPEWVLFFGTAGSVAVSELGFRGHSAVTQGEAWVGVVIKGHKLIQEVATTKQKQQTHFSNGINMHLFLPKDDDEGPRCSWYRRRSLRGQAEFCEKYEGYGDLCNCHNPFTYQHRDKAMSVNMSEAIPVAVITANKPYHLYRLLHQLLTIPGAGQTDILVVQDDYHEETAALAKLLNLTSIVHVPEGKHNQRTNTNVRFALYKIFAKYTAADKAIILEDDLLLSDDLFSYFHSTAWLLDADPTIFCVNAFSSYSLPDTAADVSKVLRVEAYPMYGWMVRREYALFIIRHWVKGEVGDWDWTLMHENNRRGRDVVVPEVSRTFHAGAAGAHVDGFEQHLYFNRMITSQLYIQTTGEHPKLENLNNLLLPNYLRNMREDLRRAMQITPDPTLRNFLPVDHPGPFSVYVRAGTRDDEYYSFRLFMMALRTYYWDTREIFRGVIRFRSNGKVLYVVGCPIAQLFCSYGPGSHGVLKPSLPLVKEVQDLNDAYEQSLYEIVQRIPNDPQHTREEPIMEKLMGIKAS